MSLIRVRTLNISELSFLLINRQNTNVLSCGRLEFSDTGIPFQGTEIEKRDSIYRKLEVRERLQRSQLVLAFLLALYLRVVPGKAIMPQWPI